MLYIYVRVYVCVLKFVKFNITESKKTNFFSSLKNDIYYVKCARGERARGFINIYNCLVRVRITIL